MFLLVFPSTLFRSAVYPESLFLALALLSFYNARKGRWLLAGLFGGLASLARPYGILLVIPFLYEYMDQLQFQISRIRWDIIWIGLIVIIFSFWPLYMYGRYHNPFIFVTSQSSWDRVPAAPWIVIANFFNAPLVVHGPDHSMVDLAFTLLSVVLVIYSWGMLRGSYVIYSALTLLVVISSGLLVSMMRYDLDIFPLFLALALMTRRGRLQESILPMFACLSGFFMVLFALWRWVA